MHIPLVQIFKLNAFQYFRNHHNKMSLSFKFWDTTEDTSSQLLFVSTACTKNFCSGHFFIISPDIQKILSIVSVSNISKNCLSSLSVQDAVCLFATYIILLFHNDITFRYLVTKKPVDLK